MSLNEDRWLWILEQKSKISNALKEMGYSNTVEISHSEIGWRCKITFLDLVNDRTGQYFGWECNFDLACTDEQFWLRVLEAMSSRMLVVDRYLKENNLSSKNGG